MNWVKYTKSAKGIPEARIEIFPLKNFPVNTRKMENANPKRMDKSMCYFKNKYLANIIVIIEE